MAVFIGAPTSVLIDDDELIRMRAHGVDPDGFDAIELTEGPGRGLREQFKPGAIIAKDQKLFEVVAAFRLVDEPTIWRFLSQGVPDTATEREVYGDLQPYWGFNWKDVLPKIMWDFLFHSERDVQKFYLCLSAQNNGRFYIFTTQELLAARVLVRGDQTGKEPIIYVPDPKYRPEGPIIQEFNLLS